LETDASATILESLAFANSKEEKATSPFFAIPDSVIEREDVVQNIE